VLLVVDVIACVLFLIFKTRLWLIRGVGMAWTDEENDYNYKRLLGPEQSKMLTATRASPAVSVWLSSMIMLEAVWIY